MAEGPLDERTIMSYLWERMGKSAFGISDERKDGRTGGYMAYIAFWRVYSCQWWLLDGDWSCEYDDVMDSMPHNMLRSFGQLQFSVQQFEMNAEYFSQILVRKGASYKSPIAYRLKDGCLGSNWWT